MNAQWALHIQTEQGSREFALTRPTVTLGRAPDNDVVLQDALVSGHHARLDVGPGGCTVTDLGSTNGSWLNGHRLSPQTQVPMASGGTLRLGQCTIVLVAQSQPVAAPPPGGGGQPTILGPERRPGPPVAGAPGGDAGGVQRPPRPP